MIPNFSQMRIAMIMGAKTLLRLEVREHGGPNRGEVVDKIITRQGGTPGKYGPWCAAFWSTLYELACGVTGVRPAFDPGMSTSEIVRLARKAGKITESPLPGDAACFKSSKSRTGYYHTAMVLTPPDSNGDYLTIEGNRSDAVKQAERNTNRHPATFVSCE